MQILFGRRAALVGGVSAAMIPPVSLAAEPGRSEAQMKEDWPWLGRYAADNQALLAKGAATAVVFMGDSITEGWKTKDPGFFQPSWICRGIGGQTSPQMVLRMATDVVALRPKILHILAGTNDVAGNTGPMTAAMTVANVRAMVAIAKDAGIKVLAGAIPPASAFYWNPAARPAAKIIEINQRLEALAKEREIGWVDYHAVLRVDQGGFDRRYSDDGVHPNAMGYAQMKKLAEPAIARILKGNYRRGR
ncbi:MAG: GDSL-type esterase/lipase family protein [Chakrabartia sp.]